MMSGKERERERKREQEEKKKKGNLKMTTVVKRAK
jgi:hypothetical protein